MPPRTGGLDRGSSTLELAILAPVLLFVSFLVVQTALWFHARDVAQSAVAQGARAARAYNGTSADGRTVTADFFTRAGGARLTAGPARINASRGLDTVSVTLEASSISVFPGVHLPIHARAGGPVERFVPAGP